MPSVALQQQTPEEIVQSLRLRAQRNDIALLGALVDLGHSKHNERQLPEAIAAYREALELAIQSKSAVDIAKIRRNLANCYQDAGHLDRASEIYDQIRPSHSASPEERFKWLNGRALLAERSGDAELTTKLFLQLVSLFNKQQRPYGRAIFALFNAGAWFAPRDPAFALHLLRRFTYWAKKETLQDARLMVPALRAEIAKAQNNLAIAEACWREAHAIAAAQEPGAKPSVAIEWADVLKRQGRRAEATAILRPYAEGDELTSPAIAARTEFATSLLGEDGTDPITLAPEELAEAETCLRRALSGEAMRGMPEIEWRILAALAGIAYHRNRLDAAILLGKAAIAGILRMPQDGEDSANGRELSAPRLYPYLKLIDRLAEADRFAEASAIWSGMHRETVFQLRGRNRAFDPRHRALPLLPAEQRALDAFRQHCDRLRRLRFESEAPALTPTQADAIKRASLLAHEKLAAWLDSTLALRPRQPRAKPVTPIHAPARGAGSLYFTRRSNVWTGALHTASGIHTFEIQGTHQDLARAIFDFRSAILEKSTDWKRLASVLFQNIVGPMAHRLRELTRLEIAPHGPFSFLPFAALYDGEHCLIERIPITMKSGIAVHPPPSARIPKVLLVGAADARLRHVKAELDAIARMCRKPLRLESFTAKSFAAGLAVKPAIVHIASHFAFDPVHPERSYVQLDRKQNLSLATFSSERFDLSGVDLLVLSACDTAMTERGIYGPESLAGLAQSKGANQVVGTLWPVHDMSSGAFMQVFYKSLLDKKTASFDAASALQHAQRLLSVGRRKRGSTAATALGAPKGDWHHPYYWAGYALFVGTRDATIARP